MYNLLYRHTIHHCCPLIPCIFFVCFTYKTWFLSSLFLCFPTDTLSSLGVCCSRCSHKIWMDYRTKQMLLLFPPATVTTPNKAERRYACEHVLYNKWTNAENSEDCIENIPTVPTFIMKIWFYLFLSIYFLAICITWIPEEMFQW